MIFITLPIGFFDGSDHSTISDTTLSPCFAPMALSVLMKRSLYILLSSGMTKNLPLSSSKVPTKCIFFLFTISTTSACFLPYSSLSKSFSLTVSPLRAVLMASVCTSRSTSLSGSAKYPTPFPVTLITPTNSSFMWDNYTRRLLTKPSFFVTLLQC